MAWLTQEQIASGYYRIMLVGPPKTGKTQSLASLYWYMRDYYQRRQLKWQEQPHKLFIFDLDDTGSSTLIRIASDGSSERAKPRLPGGWLNDLQIARGQLRGEYARLAEDTSDVKAERSSMLFEQFRMDFNSVMEMRDPKTGGWLVPAEAPFAIAIDSATALENIITDHVLRVRGREINGKDANERARFADWGAIKDKELEIVHKAKSLPCHFVFCVHDELRQLSVSGTPEVRTDAKGNFKEVTPVINTGDVYIYPALTGNLRDLMAQEFDAVFYTRVDGDNYRWITKPRQEGIANLRSAGTRLRDDLTTVCEQDFRKVLVS